MTSLNSCRLARLFAGITVTVAVLAFVPRLPAQLVASDDAVNYLVNANWTNGANLGSGFTPWAIITNGPNFQGTYINSATNPPVFVNATTTNVTGTNYADVWGIFANGPDGENDTVAYRGFANPLGTNTFKLQWGSRGAGVTTLTGGGQIHGWCGFTLRNGNATNTVDDFQTGVLLYIYFLDGNAPSTLYVWDGNGVQSVPGTSFSDLGRTSITNAVQAEVTVASDQLHYHLVLKDVVQGRTLYTLNSVLMSQATVDSAALFCKETTGDQVYNKMQIAVPLIPPTISNLQPTNGSIYIDPSTTTVSFEVDSFNSTVSNSAVSVRLNGVVQPNLTFNTSDPTNQLGVSCAVTLAPDTFYNGTIVAQDANGAVSTNNFTFNTFLATDWYIDAYDYNYNSGLFIDSPTPTNGFANLPGNNGVDYLISDLTGVNNTAGYRPGDLPQILPLDVGDTGDPIDHANLRLNGYTAYNIGFTDTGNWENYTRTAPVATNYNIYARAASAAGGQFEIEKLANATATSSNQPSAALGRVNVPNTGGSKVFSGQLIPLTDAYGNTVAVPLAGMSTLRETALSSRGYNLEYLILVAITNATSTLRPYLSVASPGPNATGVNLAGQITFTIANRLTTVVPSSIKLFTNGVQVSAGLVLSNNAAGSVGTFTIPANLVANSTNTVTVTCTDSANVNLTNTWTFVTGTAGGVTGSGLWSGGAGSADMNWSTAANWTGATPGPGFNATFASAGATNGVIVDNIVASNLTVQGLFYNTNNSGFRTTMIQDGITLTVTNGATGVTPILQVGGLFNSDNSFNPRVTNTIIGSNATLIVAGNPPGVLNQLNFQIRQCANPPVAEQVVLDMSGLGKLIATVGKFYVAQGGSGSFQSNVSARVNLARTNVITCLRANAGQFEVGDSSGGTVTLPGSTLNLGITNAFFADTVRFGKQKATNNLVRFNPAFTGLNPSVFIRGTNGLASRVTTFTIGDADTETTTPNFVQALVDFSAGSVDGLVNTMIIGRGETAAGDTGFAQGTLVLNSGTLDVSSLQVGVQRANNTATETGVVQISGPATLVSPGIVLAQAASGANAALVTGTLNVTNGTVRGSITAGGGVSTVNMNGGALVVTGSAGSSTAPLTALNFSGGSLHLKADGNATTAVVNATTVSASGTTITIDSVANVTGTQTIHLLTYTGTDPFAGFSLAPLPAGYTGSLVDASGSIDLTVSVAALPPPPSIGNIVLSGSQVVLRGTNNHGAGGTYHVLTSTNVALPRTNWTVLTNGTFEANGNFASTNSAGTNQQRFYLLQVP
jgi:hypothetical protein